MTSGESPSIHSRPVAPLIVGRYQLFDAIASGGMASVHIGRLLGASGFSRTVAIKRLHRDSALDPEFIAMFSDEARLAARIRHPNVVPTLDVVAFGDELLLVMEYVSGAALSHILAQERKTGRPTPPRIAVDIMIGVLHGLHAAHEASGSNGEPLDIVHRDVSPQNILVGVDGVARVLDFGIAKAEGGIHRSQPNQVKGKLSYLSPESVTAQRVTRATDIYSASVVLWEMLAGRRLFAEQNNAEVVLKIMTGSLLPPSHFHPHISKRLDEIVMCGLSRDAGARHATARAMAAALESAVTAVTRNTVSEWVFSHVGEELRERAGLVAHIERDALAESAAAEQAAATPLQALVTETVQVRARPSQAISGLVLGDTKAVLIKNGNLISYFAFAIAACLFGFAFFSARQAMQPLPLVPTPPARAASGLPSTLGAPRAEGSSEPHPAAALPTASAWSQHQTKSVEPPQHAPEIETPAPRLPGSTPLLGVATGLPSARIPETKPTPRTKTWPARLPRKPSLAKPSHPAARELLYQRD